MLEFSFSFSKELFNETLKQQKHLQDQKQPLLEKQQQLLEQQEPFPKKQSQKISQHILILKQQLLNKQALNKTKTKSCGLRQENLKQVHTEKPDRNLYKYFLI